MLSENSPLVVWPSPQGMAKKTSARARGSPLAMRRRAKVPRVSWWRDRASSGVMVLSPALPQISRMRSAASTQASVCAESRE